MRMFQYFSVFLGTYNCLIALKFLVIAMDEDMEDKKYYYGWIYAILNTI